MPRRPLSHSQRQGRQRADTAYEQQRLSTPALAKAKAIRSSARWQNVRALVLAKQPLCADPYREHARRQHVVVATQVDHKTPLAWDTGAAFSEENLQPLCSSCHAKKSSLERRGMLDQETP